MMPSCEGFIQKLFEENSNLTDKEIIAKMKELKDEKGKRLYKTSTIASRLRQFRARQLVPSEPPKMDKIDLGDAKKEVEEAFGRRDEMNKEVKKVHAFDFFDNNSKFVEQKFMSQDEAEDHATKTNTVCKLNIAHKSVEPQETESGHKVYDGRIDSTRKKVDNLVSGTNKKPQETSDSKDIVIERLDKIDKRIETMGKEILQLKQGGQSVDEFIDVQIRESILGKLDAIKEDAITEDNPTPDLSDTIDYLLEQKGEVKEISPGFLEKVSLDKNGSVHGKLFRHDSKWRFVKRARPIVYGVGGAVAGGVGVFALIVLLKLLELLPEWL